MSVNSFRLLTLGRLALLAPDGSEEESLGKRRLKLALLAVLATARRPLMRDQLVEMFWGDQDERRARHSLSDALSHLRRIIGQDAVATRSAEITLEPRAALEVDAAQLTDDAAAGRFDRVVAGYTGSFLDGVHVAGSDSFEHWLDGERTRLRSLFLAACAKESERLAARGDHDARAAVTSRWLDVDPLSVRAALALLDARAALPGHESAWRAVADVERLAARLKREFDTAPAPEVLARVRQIRDAIPAGVMPPRESSPPPPVATAARRAPAVRLQFAAAALAVLAAIAAGWRLARHAGDPRGAVAGAVADSSADWLANQHFLRSVQAASEGRFVEQTHELDLALARDSTFIAALRDRLEIARHNDTALATRLSGAYRRFAAHASEWDRMVTEQEAALHNGEHRRSEELARELVARFPEDPRAWGVLGGTLVTHGAWDAADSVFRRIVALDSLGVRSASSSCAPCVGYSNLAGLRAMRGDLAGAVTAARAWVALQPDLPGPWSTLSTLLSYQGRFDDALEAVGRAAALSPGDPQYQEQRARLMLTAGRYDDVEATIAPWRGGHNTTLQVAAFDLQVMLERERGRFRAARRLVDETMTRLPGAGFMALVQGNTLSRLGEYARARRVYAELRDDHTQPTPEWMLSLVGDRARTFCWTHALMADAIAPTGDTVTLLALADSIAQVSMRSYYARDWRLAHHVRGLVLLAAGRHAEAVVQLDSARWGVAGWTATDLALARAWLGLGRPLAAVRVLREAQAGPLDAMGRYVPRSELDYWIALAFRRAGQPDSASVYAARVRSAWRDADPEIRARLSEL